MMKRYPPRPSHMRKVFLKWMAAICLLYSMMGIAHGEVWQLLVTGPDARQYIDKQSIASAVKAVEYWDRLALAKPQVIGNGKVVQEIRSLSIANCAARTIASEYFAVYGPHEKLLDIGPAGRIFRPVEQGSKGAAVLDYVCKAKSNPATLAQRKGGAAALLALLNAPSVPFSAPKGKLTRFAALINQEATAQHIDPALVKAIIAAESGFNPYAVSPKGALGLMQLIPATARRFGVTQLLDPKENIRAGVEYLGYLLKLFNQNIRLAVAAYNAGESAVIKHGNQVPPYPETLRYVPRVIAFYNRYK